MGMAGNAAEVPQADFGMIFADRSPNTFCE
jgi:hypothetical protein